MAMYERDIYDDGPYKTQVPQHMRTNTMLVRHQLGKVKPTTRALPPSDHTYGYTDPRDDEGASEVVNSWAEHHAVPRSIPGRDFAALNKHAAMNSCTTAKNFSAFRRTNDIRLGGRAASITHQTSSFPDSSTVFGRRSPPSAPISDLLNNNYQRTWIEEQRMQKTMRGSRKTSKNYSQTLHTKASLGHTKVAAPPPKPMFKLSQFRNVPSRISMGDYAQTYDEERARSMNNEMDETRPRSRTPIAGRRAGTPIAQDAY